VTGARAERELVAEIRSELAAVEPRRACDRIAQAAAFSGFTWRARRARQAPLVRSAIRLGHRPGDDTGTWSWEGSAGHCRIAYLRGLFLTHGSLSLANGRVHLEFVLDPADAERLAAQLGEMGLPATWRIRRGRGVVTWKSADTVAMFLRMAGARTSLFDLEARRVARLLGGELNRLLNAEAANLGRTVDSAARQLGAIEELGADGRLAALPRDGRVVAQARRDAPEATLGELAEATGLHRSAVQRELRRIERLAADGPTGAAVDEVEGLEGVMSGPI
jgi:WhiA C-terminal HTH domain/WhiA LAGLIDADG-like domain